MQNTVLPEARLEQATADSGTYRLLARLWLREVDETLLGELRRAPFSVAFEQAGGKLPRGEANSVLDSLAIDYCQLLVGPKGHLPPFQSVWQSGQFQAQATTSMQQFIQATGYDLGDRDQAVMVDHLGIQLDVMGHLLDHFTTLLSDPEQCEPWQKLIQTFLIQHLAWTEDFLSSAGKCATTEFYRSVVELTQDFLHCQSQCRTADPSEQYQSASS